MGDEDYSSILLIETRRFSESGLYAEYFNNPSSCCIPNIFMPETENTGERDTFTIGDLSIPRAQLKGDSLIYSRKVLDTFVVGQKLVLKKLPPLNFTGIYHIATTIKFSPELESFAFFFANGKPSLKVDLMDFVSFLKLLIIFVYILRNFTFIFSSGWDLVLKALIWRLACVKLILMEVNSSLVKICWLLNLFSA